MSMLPENNQGSYREADELDEFHKNVAGTLVLSNDRVKLEVYVFWFGPMLFVGSKDNHLKIDQICPTHAELYGAELGKPTKGICEFCGSGSSYRFKRK